MKTLASTCGFITAVLLLIAIIVIPIELNDLDPEDNEYYL